MLDAAELLLHDQRAWQSDIYAPKLRHHNICMPLSRKRRLSFVREADASGRTLEIYQEIKNALGVPHLNAIFQAYGAYPRFLDLMWKSLDPVLETGEFFEHADRLRAEAYTAMHNYFVVPDLGTRIRQIHLSTGAQRELTSVVDLFHYNDPLILLIAAVQLQAFEDAPVAVRVGRSGADHPVFTQKPVMLTEEAASAPIRKIYEEIKRSLRISFIGLDFQSFAHWPDFLSLYLDALKPVISSPLYGEHKHALRGSALTLATGLPNAAQLSVEHMKHSGIADEEISTAIHIAEEFLDQSSGSVLNVAFGKISLEGGNQIRVARNRRDSEQKQLTREDLPGRAA